MGFMAKKYQTGYVKASQSAWTALRANKGKIARLMLAQWAIKLAALALPLALVTFAPWPVWIAWALMGGMVLLAVLPLRFRMGELLRSWSSPRALRAPRSMNYGAWLKAGLLRGLRGLIWGLPFFAGLFFLLYGMEYMPFNEMGKIFQRFALGSGGTTADGMKVYGILMALSLVVLLVGWWRDAAMEFLPVRRLRLRALRRLTAQVRRRDLGRGRMVGYVLVNGLMMVPVLLGYGLVMLPYVQAKVRVSSNMLMTLNSILSLVKQPLPAPQIVGLLAVLVALHMPVYALRKMRLATLTRRLSRDLEEGGQGRAPR